MTQNIIKADQFSAESIQFSKVRKNKRGGKNLFVNADGKRFYLQLPELRAPFGLSKFEDENSGNVSYSLDLSLDGYDEEGSVKSLHDLLTNIDEQILDHVHSNSKELLGKEYNKDVLEALYKPMVRVSDKGDYAPTIKLKVGHKDGVFIPEAYTNDKQKTEMGNIEKGTRCKTLVEIAMIWFIDNKFGPSVRLSQAMVTPQAKLDGCAFQSDDEDDFETFEDEM
jgi:hypothetical protein